MHTIRRESKKSNVINCASEAGNITFLFPYFATSTTNKQTIQSTMNVSWLRGLNYKKNITNFIISSIIYRQNNEANKLSWDG